MRHFQAVRIIIIIYHWNEKIATDSNNILNWNSICKCIVRITKYHDVFLMASSEMKLCTFYFELFHSI